MFDEKLGGSSNLANQFPLCYTGNGEMMKAPKKRIPIGITDFKDMITEDYYYVDKTLLIKEIIDRGDKIILLPRPRRFGKTLNLSMVRYFFDCCPETGEEPRGKKSNPTAHTNPYKPLFDSLAIAKEDKKYLDKMGNHPVIFLSFKDVKLADWESCLLQIKQLIADEYSKHRYLLQGDHLVTPETDFFNRVVSLKGTIVDYQNSLGKLLMFLNRYYGKKPIILIDEYDAPVHMGYNCGYYDDIITFMRNFLSGGLKDTDKYLEKGIVTGIMRIAKESIFSGLNNPGVFPLTAEEFDDKFGFTPGEIETLLENFELTPYHDDIWKWYNGYRFGAQLIYNPWSILNFTASKSKKCQPYWVNTADNTIVESLLSKGGKELKKELEVLIRGETIEKVIEENIVLKDIENDESLLWSFLLMGGYVTYKSWRQDDFSGQFIYTLCIPNREVKTTYIRLVKNFFSRKTSSESVQLMLDALVQGNIKVFGKKLRSIIMNVFSYNDFAVEPERVYHALVTGLLVWLSGSYEIKSNQESGYGRYDIMIIPRDPGDPSLIGYVIEFKTVNTDDNETPESALTAALQQIEEKKYTTELQDRGIKKIIKLAIAFKGKEIFLKSTPQSGAL